MSDEPVEEDLRGLPPAAVDRVRHQRASGVRGSLLTAAGAAAIRSVGLEPVGEVFGCVVLTLGWAGGGCGYGYGWNRAMGGGARWTGGIPGTVGGGIAGGTSSGTRMAPPGWQAGYLGGGPIGGWRTPVVVSGDMGSSRFAWARPYAEAVSRAWADAHDRMLTEARALGADGVLGIRRSLTRVAGGGHEYAGLATAVRFTDPTLRRPAQAAPWAATLTPEDCAAAASAGFLPAGVATGYSLALKHEDWQLKQQRGAWNNTEVDGLTELLAAARGDARRTLTLQARRLARAGELVVTSSSLHTGERPCGEEKDMTAEALFVGTVLVPHPAPPARRGRALTVLPLTPPTAAARRRRP
ncbi:MAG TPA: hypothetical protein VEV65_00130 [Kineosporiaceae bacterium]|nr:hypothetical protein [Kineosporiaceae bacterium]